ncbi:hypothetical protein [Saccharothrix syringae]|uniref:3-oxoacyl-ACP synthase n=1 Tax=Saccharothrix syringae TaxID=103733 RepID=A0A5Q0GZD7_SACSY|nr:hypothetical protein [Saccharothrix syringae]QFZ18900.1 hypothetical protein EKG83_16870 [Saccharothrix syringae]
MTEPLPHLSGFAACLGAREAIRDAADPDLLAEATALHAADLRHYRRTDRDVVELATRSATRTLAAAATPPAAAVYTSDTFAGTPTKALRQVLDGTGLGDADGTVVGGRGCDNLWPALDAARSRLTGRAGVLVVTADRVDRGTRLNQDARTVMSDGAASCLVSLDSRGPAVRLRAGAALPVSPPPGAPPLLRARHHVTALRALSDRLFAEAGLAREGCTSVITSNVGLNVAQMFRSAVGGRDTALYRPRATDVGHCFAADGLHTLGLWLGEPGRAAGDVVLVVATSPHSCSLMLLEALTPGEVEVDA